ncbi:hypothetical protein KIW84_058154, partial [Lathyrus oleraceus]
MQGDRKMQGAGDVQGAGGIGDMQNTSSGQHTPIANDPSQPNQQTTTAHNLPPTGLKKRRLDENGNIKRSEVWDHFNLIPDSDPPITECKYCHKMYMHDSKKHGRSNLKSHMKTCLKYALNVSIDPTQRILLYSTTKGNMLVPLSSRFNHVVCING